MLLKYTSVFQGTILKAEVFISYKMQQPAHRYFIVNKPYNMLSQFKGPFGARMLGNINFDFPENIHAVGRLDSHSEGLLILTTNKKITKLLFESEKPHNRTYLVLVKNVVRPETLERLRSGIKIRVKGGGYYTTPPCEVHVVNRPDDLYEGQFECQSHWPHSWLLITLTEGKFHQVRKMVFAVSHRCLRLVRISIEDMQLGGLQPGCVKEIEEEVFFRQLKLT